jgi:predicted ArsR family transcriptional regulator
MNPEDASTSPGGVEAPARLDILKALGDNTRYAIYLELARAPAPRSTAQVSQTLDLHPNTVRPHLERMREVGLLDVEVASGGGVGRPQHLYTIAPDAPSLGLEPPLFPRLASMLLAMAAAAGADGAEAVEAGRSLGRDDSRRVGNDRPCIEALAAQLAEFGFDPEVALGETTTIGFAHCPFASLAEANPELVCGLHRGMVEGFVEAFADAAVLDFRNLVHRQPCQVELAAVS